MKYQYCQWNDFCEYYGTCEKHCPQKIKRYNLAINISKILGTFLGQLCRVITMPIRLSP